jgi:hypothetical protein
MITGRLVVAVVASELRRSALATCDALAVPLLLPAAASGMASSLAGSAATALCLVLLEPYSKVEIVIACHAGERDARQMTMSMAGTPQTPRSACSHCVAADAASERPLYINSCPW